MANQPPTLMGIRVSIAKGAAFLLKILPLVTAICPQVGPAEAEFAGEIMMLPMGPERCPGARTPGNTSTYFTQDTS